MTFWYLTEWVAVAFDVPVWEINEDIRKILRSSVRKKSSNILTMMVIQMMLQRDLVLVFVRVSPVNLDEFPP